MVTITVLSIIAVLAAPSFSDLIAAQRSRAAASDLFTSLIRARSEAIKRNGSVIISPVGGDWTAGWSVEAVGSTDGPLERHGPIARLTIDGPDSVTYRSSGRVLGTATVQFSVSAGNSLTQRCVEVDLSGRPTQRSSAC